MNLRQQFEKAGVEICENLGMSGEVEYRFLETKKLGVDYTARLHEGDFSFDFHIRTDTEEEDPTTGKMTAHLSISYDPALADYYFGENITFLKSHSNFLCRWAFWAIYNYRLRHKPINLEYLFGEGTLRVYGEPGYGADQELEIMLNWLLNNTKEKVICYKFGHVESKYLLRKFSYAFYINLNYYIGFWAFFPDCSGLDSGGSGRSYRFIEENIEMINKKVGVEIRRYDINFEDLKLYLLKRADDFFTIFREESNNIITFLLAPYVVLGESSERFDRFVERYEQKQYPEALRDLRALVQDAQEYVLIENSIEIPENPNINRLTDLLISNNLLEGRLKSWFLTFCSIANLSSHGDFPSKKDMGDSLISKRYFLIVKLGLHILKELDYIIHKPITFDDVSFNAAEEI